MALFFSDNRRFVSGFSYSISSFGLLGFWTVEQWSGPPPAASAPIKAGRVRPRPRPRWDRGRSGTSSASGLCLHPPHPTCWVCWTPRGASSSGRAPPRPAASAAGRPVWTHPACWRSLETEERPGPPWWSARCPTPASRCRLGGLQAERGDDIRGLTRLLKQRVIIISVFHQRAWT